MYTLDEFNERLQDVFGGRLRLRWSDARQEFHLEERVGRAAPHLIADLPYKSRRLWRQRHDDRVRARDGYALVMRVAQGTRAGCPACFLPLRVPELETREVVCAYCRERGNNNASIIAAYFPLGEVFIDYLRRSDPMSDGTRRRVEDMKKAERWEKFVEEKDDDAYLHDLLYDEAIRQLPKVGYTGKEFKD